MDLKQCMENLKQDVNNGGIVDDSIAANFYITMANEARRILNSGLSDQKAADARAYLSICCSSGSDSLRYIAAR